MQGVSGIDGWQDSMPSSRHFLSRPRCSSPSIAPNYSILLSSTNSTFTLIQSSKGATIINDLIEEGIDSIDQWLSSNWIKLNRDKPEITCGAHLQNSLALSPRLHCWLVDPPASSSCDKVRMSMSSSSAHANSQISSRGFRYASLNLELLAACSAN